MTTHTYPSSARRAPTAPLRQVPGLLLLLAALLSLLACGAQDKPFEGISGEGLVATVEASIRDVLTGPTVESSGTDSTQAGVPAPDAEHSVRPGTQDLLRGVDFGAIDQHALQAPASAMRSVESLAAYLIQPASNDLEKTRAIYRWITENITYDVEAYLDENRQASSPEGTLSSGKAVCSGYSGLFAQLADAAGLTIVEISGWAKGFGYDVGDPIVGPTNHAWNAVEIDSAWYLIDSTWGAGSVNDQMQFERRFDEFYFLAPPEQFIYAHLPEDPEWQLLAAPLSTTEFEAMPRLRPAFFRYGLDLGSGAQGVVDADNQASLDLGAPAGILLLAELEQDRQRLPRTLVFAQREGDQLQISALFPTAGDYYLRIYAKRQTDPGDYESAADYKIVARQGTESPAGFPAVYTGFQEEQSYLYSPMTGHLQPGTIQSFRLSIPHAEQVAVIMGEDWTFLAKTGSLFEGQVEIHPGEIYVGANFPDEEQYQFLLGYTGD